MSYSGHDIDFEADSWLRRWKWFTLPYFQNSNHSFRVSVRKTDTSQGPTVIPLALILSNGDHVPVHLTVPPMGRGAETSIKTKKYLISPPGETRFALIAAPNTYDNLYVFQVSGGAELWYAVGSSALLIIGAVIGALAQRLIGG